MAEQRMQVEIDGSGVADVRFTRPDKLNALDAAMFDAIAKTSEQLAAEPGLRAVVLSGEGRGFCAGLDVASFAALGSGGGGKPGLLSRERDAIATRAQLAAWVWHELPVPVIAAVHGVCFGGGLQIAAAADVRFVTPDARLSVMEIKWGLVPDMSGTQTLRHLLRLDVLKELTFTGRIVDGCEAERIGLATHVDADPHAAALALAREIAGRSPSAVRAGKQLLNAAVTADEASGLALEARLQAGLIAKPDQIEAVKANLEKRPPRFAGSGGGG